MKRETQRAFIVERLEGSGEISRNDCLSNYISRLGAYIADLKAEGWEFDATFVDTGYGKDYVYKVTKQPPRTLFSRN